MDSNDGPLSLQSLVLRNWVKFADAHLQFPRKGGLVVVTGINSASGGKLRSVGSGKTAAGEALGCVLFGIQNRFTKLGDASRDRAGDTYVRIEAIFRGKPLLVEAGYKCPEINPRGEGLRFTFDGQAIERGHIDQTREELNQLLGMNPGLAGWTVFVDGEYMKFGRLAQQDSVDLVMAALGQPPWSAYHERAKRSLLASRKDLARDQGLHQASASHLEDIEKKVEEAKAAHERALADYRQRQEALAARLQERDRLIEEQEELIQASAARQEAIATEVRRLVESHAAGRQKLELEMRQVQERLRQNKLLGTAFGEAQMGAHDVYVCARNAYQALAATPENCPTCGRAWERRDASPERLEEARQALEKASGALEAAREAAGGHEKKVRKLETQFSQLEQKIRDLGAGATTALSLEHARLDAAIQKAHARIGQLRLETEVLSETALQAAQTILEERQRSEKLAQEGLERASTALGEARGAVEVVDYWCTAFSPVGIPNRVLRESMDVLNQEARRVSTLLTGGSLEVRFATERTLVGGEQRPRLGITLDNKLGSPDVRFNSKGEGGLANFIVAETLGLVGRISRRVAFRWYDEIVPHQDEVVCQSLYSYLRELAHSLEILVFMVDHNPLVNNYADYFLQVEKTGDGKSENGCVSVVRWL